MNGCEHELNLSLSDHSQVIFRMSGRHIQTACEKANSTLKGDMALRRTAGWYFLAKLSQYPGNAMLFFPVKKGVHHFVVCAREDVLLDIISGFLEADAWSSTCFITRTVHDGSSADLSGLSGNGLQSTQEQVLIVSPC